MDNLTNTKNNFQEFNQFQTYFYTNINQFKKIDPHNNASID